MTKAELPESFTCIVRLSDDHVCGYNAPDTAEGHERIRHHVHEAHGKVMNPDWHWENTQYDGLIVIRMREMPLPPVPAVAAS